MVIGFCLLQVLAPQQRLEVADPRLGDDADPDRADDEQHIPRSLVAWANRGLQAVADSRAESGQQALDQGDVRCVAELAWRWIASDSELQTHHPGRDRSLDEVRIRREPPLIAADRLLSQTGGCGHARLAQTSSQARVPELVSEMQSQLSPA
ncbi:MAG TPA: hypothetical protein VFQ46_02790 [Candidatus Limnocylindria bacterium]|nr:hypothetical protein [Candidatus Limnocylindria bacterium]